jgi:hypothetical protein
MRAIGPIVGLRSRIRRGGVGGLKARNRDVKNKHGWWPLVGVAGLMSMALAGCGGSEDDAAGSTSLRLVNATLTHPSLDLYISSSRAAAAIAADTLSTYLAPASGGLTLQLTDPDASTALTTTVPTLGASAHYTLLAYESGGVVKTQVLGEDFAAPTSGTLQLRVFDAAPEAGQARRLHHRSGHRPGQRDHRDS